MRGGCQSLCQVYTARFDLSQQIILFLKVLPMEDHCVYARNLLGRLTSIYGTSATPTYSQSQTSQSNFVNPGSMIMIAAIIILLLMNLRNRRKTPQSKLE